MPSEPFWALCYHTNSHSPRAKKWYYIARVIEVDGMLFELYWLPDNRVKRGSNRLEVRAAAAGPGGVALRPGVYTQYRGPSVGGSQLTQVQ